MASFPNDWLCPITLQIMRDPVIGADGYTYERSAITTWLSSNSISPMTRQSMTGTMLTPNLALRHTIEEYLAANPGPVVPPQPALANRFVSKPTTVESRTFTVADKQWLHVRVSAPATGERQPIVLVPIIDNSGSMGSSTGAVAGGEDHGFTRLDLVKHAVRTMSAILTDQDSMGLVSFSTDGRVLLAPTSMNAAGKRRVEEALEGLRPDASTNIFDGIRKAAALLADPAFEGHNIVAMLLTDGYPTINPPRGIVPTLNTVTRPARWTLHTFGFGYDLDSALCAEIAEWGQGLFGFIPDATMVGTVFINALAHVLSTANLNTAFTYTPAPTTALITVNTGPVSYGQPRDFLFEVTGAPLVNGEAVAAGDPGHVLIHKMYIDVIAKAIDICKRVQGMTGATEAQAVLAGFESQFSSLDNPIVKALLRDLRAEKEGEGQIGLAPVHFRRWGQHYMLAYKRAQELQQCMNFKDPGLQIYGGELFHALQDAGDRAFCDLPAPKPSGRPVASYGGAASHMISPANMALFHNASAGCFAPDTNILCPAGRIVKISELKRGDSVWTPSGYATVRALVVCGSYKRAQPMTMLGGLVITPWHPVCLQANRVLGPSAAADGAHPVRLPSAIGDSPWRFPADINGYSDRLIPTVYNLVLDSGHIVWADGYHALTLGHGFTEPVAQHDYFGTDRVIQDLMKQPGWDEGCPTYKNLATRRDPATGNIVGWFDDV